MRNFRFNWAVILALIVLLVFTYFSFMGALYNDYVNGDLLKGGIYALSVIIIVSICVVVMCVSKATRWKEIGTAGQIFFAFVILAVFGFSAIPFTGFMIAIESKEGIQEKIDNTKSAADTIDQLYNDYVADRIAQYEDWLREDMNVRLKIAGGSTEEEKIANLKTSLENHLKPQSLENCQKERKEWLSKIEGMSVWNIMLPRNLDILEKCVIEWTADYVNLSNISYDGNSPVLFPNKKIEENQLKELGEINISLFAIVAALLAFFFMLLPYIVTESFIGSRTTGSKEKKKPKGPAQVEEEEKDYE